MTDHQEVPFIWKQEERKEHLIPGADAVVNPFLPGDPWYPFKGSKWVLQLRHKVVEALYTCHGTGCEMM